MLLSTSVLYALRHAVEAARTGLADLEPSSPALAPSHHNGALMANGEHTRNGTQGVLSKEYLEFEAPATVVKIKEVIVTHKSDYDLALSGK